MLKDLISKKIKIARTEKRHKITQEELADKLNVSQNAVYQWEKGNASLARRRSGVRVP